MRVLIVCTGNTCRSPLAEALCKKLLAEQHGCRPEELPQRGIVVLSAGLAAMMNVVQSPQVDPNSGAGLELKAIAAVVVGGVAISGGRGSLWGAFVGLLLLACVNPALTHLRVEAYWEKAIQGVVILLAVVADGLRTRKERN